MRRIAAQAGVTTGAITRYFPGRQALLLEAVAAIHFAARARMQIAAALAATPMQRLEAVVLEGLPLDAVRLREWRVWSSFRSAAPRGSALWAAYEAGYADWGRRFLRTLFEPICFNPDDARREVSLLTALVDGLGARLVAISANHGELEVEQRRAAEDIRFYLEALAARHPRGDGR